MNEMYMWSWMYLSDAEFEVEKLRLNVWNDQKNILNYISNVLNLESELKFWAWTYLPINWNIKNVMNYTTFFMNTINWNTSIIAEPL